MSKRVRLSGEEREMVQVALALLCDLGKDPRLTRPAGRLLSRLCRGTPGRPGFRYSPEASQCWKLAFDRARRRRL